MVMNTFLYYPKCRRDQVRIYPDNTYDMVRKQIDDPMETKFNWGKYVKLVTLEKQIFNIYHLLQSNLQIL